MGRLGQSIGLSGGLCHIPRALGREPIHSRPAPNWDGPPCAFCTKFPEVDGRLKDRSQNEAAKGVDRL